MTDDKQKRVLAQSSCGTLIGLSLGGIIALVIATKPERFAGLSQ